MEKIIIKDVLTIVNTYLKDVTVTEEQLNENLSDMGMDSLIFIQIVVAIEEKFNLEIPDTKLFLAEMNTVNKICAVITSTLQ